MDIKKINKKIIIDILLIIFITTFSLLFLFQDKIILGDDLTFHLNRFLGIANCFEDGQIPPRIYPYANNYYGYATPLFYCDLFLYPFGVLFHYGLSAVYCYKLCIFTYTLLGNLFVYYIFKKETDNRKISLIAVILYCFASYHIQNVYVRAALGEILSMTFVPLVLYAIYKVLVKNKNSWILLGVSFSCMVMSHLISTFLYGMFFFVMIVVYIIINRKDFNLIKSTMITILKGTILAVLLTSWYLFPMFEQFLSQDFWLNANANYNDLSDGVQSLKQAFGNVFALINWKSFKVKKSASVGLVLSLLPFGLFFVKKNKYITAISAYCVFCYLIILGVIPGEFLNITQFYFRLYIVIFPLLVIDVVYLLLNINKRIIQNILIGVICIYSCLNVCFAVRETYNGKYYLNNDATFDEINYINSYLFDLDYNHDELGGFEYAPYTELVDYIDDGRELKIMDEYGVYVYLTEDYKQYFSTLTFTYDLKRATKIMFPISYYKGYSAYELIGDEWKKIGISYDETYKKLTIDNELGVHTYKVTYTGTPVQHITLGISVVTTVVLLIMFIKTKLWRKA